MLTCIGVFLSCDCEMDTVVARVVVWVVWVVWVVAAAVSELKFEAAKGKIAADESQSADQPLRCLFV